MQVAKHNRVQLIRLPSHEGIVGNKTAGQLAKFGSKYPHIGPEPSCGISIEVAKKAVRDWTNRDHKKHWESSTGLKRGKGTRTRTFCEENHGTVKIKQKSVMMDDRATYRALSPKRTSFGIG
jgi:hypothetical protein